MGIAKYLIRFRLTVIILFLLCGAAKAQISDQFYQALPKEYKPKDRAKLTLDEKYLLLNNANFKFRLSGFNPELDKIAAGLYAEVSQITDKKRKITALNVIAIYYFQKFSDADMALKYADIMIGQIDNDSTYFHELAEVLTIKAALVLMKGDIESCIIALREAKKIILTSKDEKERQGLGQIYATLANTYIYLELYDQADLYVDSAKFYFKNIKPAENAKVPLTIENLDKIRSYIGSYQLKNNEPGHLDQAIRIIRALIIADPDNIRWFSHSYGELGRIAYFKKQYQQSAAFLDSADLAEYAKADVSNSRYERIAFRGLNLLRTGRIKEGDALITKAIDLIKVDKSTLAVLIPIAPLYLELYKAYKETGDPKKALVYLEQYIEKKDSVNLIRKNIALADVNEKYKSAQKEAQIQKLRTEQATQKKQQRLTMMLAIAVVLLLLTIIALIYLFTNKQLQKQIRKQQELENENLRISQSLMDQEAKMLEERYESLKLLRLKISNDMHNELGSALVSLNFYINDIQNSFKDKEIAEALNNIKEEASSIYIQTRDYIHDLQDNVKDVKFDLVNFLMYLPLHFNQSTTLKIRTDIATDPLESRLSVQQNNEFYLFIKEALANILKHSGATYFTIKIDFQGENCQFSISDNGKGFDPGLEGSGMGVRNMKDRIADLGGELTIVSNKKGTVLSGFFPVTGN